MDFSEKNILAKQEARRNYTKWYSQLSDEKKFQMVYNGYDFVVQKVRGDELRANPFTTESDISMRFIELTQSDYPAATMDFIREKMKERSEIEWQERFKTMKKALDWKYEDMARFTGAASGDSIKASINRQVPAFAKLAICVFEEMSKKQLDKEVKKL